MRQTKPFLILTLLPTLSLIPAASLAAGILYITGAYEQHDIDYTALDSSLSISRKYNSRSTYTGLFGYGWCSDLDHKITEETDSDGLIKWTYWNCDLDMELQVGEQKNTYYAKQMPKTIWLYNKGQWVMHQEGKRKLSFNDQGQLVQIVERNKIPSIISYKQNQRSFDILQLDKKWTFYKSANTETVLKVMQGKDTVLHYHYGTNNNLVRVESINRIGLAYKYDEYNNLLEAWEGSLRKIVNSYDTKQDLIVKSTKLSGCTESIRYENIKDSNTLNQSVISETSCDELAPLQVLKWSFRFKLSQRGLATLQDSTREQMGQRSQIFWHPNLSLPVKIARDGNTTEMAYNIHGQVISLQQNGQSIELEYDSAHRLSHYRTKDIKLLLTYDSGGRLRKVEREGDEKAVYEKSTNSTSRLPASPAERLLLQNVFQLVKDNHPYWVS